MRTFSTRAAALLAVLFGAVALTACGGSPAAPPSAEPAVGGSTVQQYFGQLDGQPEYIAVAVEGTNVRAYVCDGANTAEWFAGTVTDGRFALDSTSGVTAVDPATERGTGTPGNGRIEGTVSGGTVTGTVTLERGGPFPFTAPVATGIAGDYTLRILDDGTVDGVSAGGVTIEGKIEQPDRVTGTYTAPDGTTGDITVGRGGGVPAPGVWNVLVTPDARAVGFGQAGTAGAAETQPKGSFPPPKDGFTMRWLPY